MQAYKNIDNLLAKDGAIGVLISPNKSNVIEFPGRARPKPVRYGPFREVGTLDGRIIRLGGRDETIPVWLKDGDVEYHCNVRGEEVARRLASYYLNGVVRLMVAANGCARKTGPGHFNSSIFPTSRCWTTAP